MTVLRYPLATEKAVGIIEKLNTITFIVDFRASKEVIAKEFEEKFEVKVKNVRVANMPKNEKKAFIQLTKGFKASEVAMKLKLV